MSFSKAHRLLSATGKKSKEDLKTLITEECLYHVVDAENNTLLHHAAKIGNHKIVQYLVEGGSDVDAENDLGQTPLMITLKTLQPSKKVIEILLKAGADIFVTEGNNIDSNPFNIVGSNEWLDKDRRKFEILRVFLEESNYLNFSNLLETGTVEVIKMLLQTGVDLSIADSEGVTLVHMLAKNPNLGVMELLRGKSYDINARDEDGWTPLMHAALNEQTKAVDFLLGEGADINAVNDAGETALYMACKSIDNEGDTECIQILLEYGANAQIEIENTTIFDFVFEDATFTVAELLLAHLVLQEMNGTIITQLVRNKIDSYGRLRTYIEHCKHQLSIKIYRSIKLFDILTASERKLESYLRDQELTSKLLVFQTAAYFDKILRKRLPKVLSMIELREAATRIICELMKISYDSYPFVAEEISSYLGKTDMECLISVENKMFS